MDLDLLVVALAAFGGGLLSSLIGWADSHEPFNGRKFFKSFITAIISGVGFAVTYSITGDIQIRDLFLAALGGAGVDSLSNRALGAVSRSPNP